ncbi:hypothetical protein BVX97_01840 [bacterium E08(2017)]|nr:hypothetical protein BVX97_01840 [bacterium E08(2017)]
MFDVFDDFFVFFVSRILYRISMSEIEELKAKLEKAEAEARFLKNILDSVDDAVFVKDTEHRWIYRNAKASSQIPDSPENQIGKTDHDYYPKEQADEFWKKDAEVFETGETNRNREEISMADGEVHVASTSKSLYVDPETQKQYIVGIIRDITEQARLENERDELIKNLKDALQKIKTLKGLIPICSSCKKIRDDDGFWHQLEAYMHENSSAEFTHGICPECAKELLVENDDT